MLLDSVRLERVQHAVLDWYSRHARDLPWRRTRDPYAILVSEMMLQQTQVDRTLDKYREFLAHYPALSSLAAATRAEVIRRWAPLGYNVRAVRLHAIAQHAVSAWGGQLPENIDDLRQLKGIGRYTAAAIACFAHGQTVPVLDTNVRRVLGRIFGGWGPAIGGQGAGWSDTLTEGRAWALAEAALPAADAYHWNQALMDLGATLCTAARPRCLLCPARRSCDYAQGRRPGAEQLRSSGVQDNSRTTRGRDRLNRRRPDGLKLVAEERVEYGGSDSTPRNQPYAGSRRYLRGRIVQALRALPPGESLALPELGRQVKPDMRSDAIPWLADVVATLERDSLVNVNRTAGSTQDRAEQWQVSLS